VVPGQQTLIFHMPGMVLQTEVVLELSYKNIGSDRLHSDDVPNTGESVLYLSPGIKYTLSSFILEALLQIPVWQDQKGSQLERDMTVIFGARYMF
jgi:hypothetical protein